MQLKMFSICAKEPGASEEALNGFLRGQRVLSVEKRLVGSDSSAFWAVCVEYLERAAGGGGQGVGERLRGKVDYREVLNEADFAVFSRLRELRKITARTLPALRDGLRFGFSTPG